jgi:predicted permease
MNVISQVSVLFLLIFMGFCSVKLKITGPEVAGYFSALILKITMPCMIVAAFQRSFERELLREMFVALGASCLIILVSVAAAAAYPHIMGLSGKERGVHRYAILVSNSGFIGYPMVEAILGSAFLFHAAIYNIPSYLVSYSLGAWFVAKEGNRGMSISWKNFVNPGIISTLLGFAFFVFSISLPAPLYRSIKMTGDVTTPLAMMVIGITFAQADVKQLFGRRRLYVLALVRLALLPALAALACYAAGIRGPLMILLVLLTGMPAGSTTFIMASVYNTAPEEGGAIVFLTTLICMVTVPLMMFALHFTG